MTSFSRGGEGTRLLPRCSWTIILPRDLSSLARCSIYDVRVRQTRSRSYAPFIRQIRIRPPYFSISVCAKFLALRRGYSTPFISSQERDGVRDPARNKRVREGGEYCSGEKINDQRRRERNAISPTRHDDDEEERLFLGSSRHVNKSVAVAVVGRRLGSRLAQ